MNFTGEVEMLLFARGMSLPRGDSPTPTTVISGLTSLSASYEARGTTRTRFPRPAAAAVELRLPEARQVRLVPDDELGHLGYVRATSCSHSTN